MNHLRASHGPSAAGRPSPIPALSAFALFLLLIFALTFDVAPIGPGGSSVGLSSINAAARDLIGVSWALYALTDWGALVPVASMLAFFLIGLLQLIKGRSLRSVDVAIWLLGAVYVAQLLLFLAFNEVMINCRPVLIDGALEPSFPSSTSLLAVGTLGSAAVWSSSRLSGGKRTAAMTACFTLATLLVVGRALSGVHWITDIVGGILLGLFLAFSYQYLIPPSQGASERERAC